MMVRAMLIARCAKQLPPPALATQSLFANGLSGTITLGGTMLTIDHSLTIKGPGAAVLTISGNDQSQVMYVFANSGLTFSLSDVTIAHGFTTSYTGGGLYVDQGSVVPNIYISKVIFDHNVADGEGAGARLNASTTVRDSIFSNNVLAGNSAAVSNTWGSGLSCDRDQCTVTGTLVTGNSGGCSALYSAAANTTFANDTATGNDFPAGCVDPGNIEPGGTVCDSSGSGKTCSFNNITSYGNTLKGSVSHADGIAVGDGITIHVSNSIIDGCGGNFFGGTVVSDDYNIDVGGSCGFSSTGDQSNVVPLLDVLADNGGFSKTLALLAGSPAIDAGNPSAPTGSGGTCQTTDQRGISRPQGAACDIGAFEYVPPPVTVPVLTTSAASSLTATGATLNGSIASTGGANATVRGFVYGATTAYGATTTESGSFSTGSFTADISSLTCNTTYHFASYATNTASTGYGSDQSFTPTCRKSFRPEPWHGTARRGARQRWALWICRPGRSSGLHSPIRSSANSHCSYCYLGYGAAMPVVLDGTRST
jgi:hypothetical protein